MVQPGTFSRHLNESLQMNNIAHVSVSDDVPFQKILRAMQPYSDSGDNLPPQLTINTDNISVSSVRPKITVPYSSSSASVMQLSGITPEVELSSCYTTPDKDLGIRLFTSDEKLQRCYSNTLRIDHIRTGQIKWTWM